MSTLVKLVVFLSVSLNLVACGDSRGTVSPADVLLADADALSRGRSLFVGTCAGGAQLDLESIRRAIWDSLMVGEMVGEIGEVL